MSCTLSSDVKLLRVLRKWRGLNLFFAFLPHRNNLLNTNEHFDYGGFRALSEAVRQMGTGSTVFAFRFADAGTYVFYLSSNPNKRLVSV